MINHYIKVNDDKWLCKIISDEESLNDELWMQMMIGHYIKEYGESSCKGKLWWVIM